MADQPTEGLPYWATNDVVETVTDPDNPSSTINVPNKDQPSNEWMNNGELWKTNLPYPYVNYTFNLIRKWIENLRDRAGGTVGDVYISTVNHPINDLNNKFGGSWTARGTQSLGSIGTSYVFERTA